MAAASSSSTSTSASCLVPSSGRFSVTLLQRERGARPESPLYTSSSPTRPASSSFCTLEKLSYVWQRQNRSVEDLVEDFETKMKSLLLSYEPPDVSSSAGQQGSLRLVVQRASASLGESEGAILSDLRCLFVQSPDKRPPTHLQVFLSSSSSPTSSASSTSPFVSASTAPSFLFFSPRLPFSPPAHLGEGRADRNETSVESSPAGSSGVLPQEQESDSKMVLNASSAVARPGMPTGNASGEDTAPCTAAHLSQAFADLNVGTPRPQIAVPPGSDSPERMKAVRRADGADPSSDEASRMWASSTESRQARVKTRNPGERKNLNPSSLVVPAGYGSAGQSRFRELMASNRTRSSLSSEEALRRISRDELSRHRTREDLWVALDGDVYDITQYLSFHPGGSRILLEHGGTDISEVFRRYHPWVNAKHILAYNQVGTLE